MDKTTGAMFLGGLTTGATAALLAAIVLESPSGLTAVGVLGASFGAAIAGSLHERGSWRFWRREDS